MIKNFFAIGIIVLIIAIVHTSTAKPTEKSNVFKLGELVYLQSGGPYMTISYIDTLAGNICTVWFDDNNQKQSGCFDVSTLRKF